MCIVRMCVCVVDCVGEGRRSRDHIYRYIYAKYRFIYIYIIDIFIYIMNL